jgi:hypothetical protein
VKVQEKSLAGRRVERNRECLKEREYSRERNQEL